jgi:hypothetical protein
MYRMAPDTSEERRPRGRFEGDFKVQAVRLAVDEAIALSR